MKVFSAPKQVPRLPFKLDPGYFLPNPIQFRAQCLYSELLIASLNQLILNKSQCVHKPTGHTGLWLVHVVAALQHTSLKAVNLRKCERSINNTRQTNCLKKKGGRTRRCAGKWCRHPVRVQPSMNGRSVIVLDSSLASREDMLELSQYSIENWIKEPPISVFP